MLQKLIKVILACALLVLGSSVAAADKPTVRVAVPDDFYPFYGTGEDGKITGISIEVARAVLANLGYSMKIAQYSDMRSCLDAMAAGRQDLMINLTETAERRKLALFTQTPHVFETQDLIVRADSTLGYDGELPGISESKIGINYGWTYGPAFDGADYLDKEVVLDSNAQLKGLLSGQFDVVLNNQQYFLNRAEKLNILGAFKVLSPSVYVLPVNIAVSKKYSNAAEFRDKLEREVSRFVKTEEYRQIELKYGFDSSLAEMAQ